MSEIKRRDFLKILGLSGASTGLVGCAQEPAQRLIPYLVHPEESIPGIPDWYASACRECPAGCGLHVKVREGRPIKVEGNPDHPVNSGRLCARGQASLQGLYNPDRITSPLRRTEAGEFQPISWEEAEELLAERIRGLRDAGASQRLYLMTDGAVGSLDRLFDVFSEALGSNRVIHESFDVEPLREANRTTFGIAEIPRFQLDEADLVVSFGAGFLETWISPVQYARAFGESQSFQNGRKGRFVHVGPRLSLTGSNADEWIATSPAGAMKLALAMTRVLVTERRSAAQSAEILRPLVEPYTPERVAETSGIEPAVITRLAREFADAPSSLALPPGIEMAGRNAAAAHVAVNLLNYAAGNVGRTVRFGPNVVRRRPAGLSRLAEMVSAMRDGTVDVLMVHGTDPVHTLPAGLGFADGLEGVGLLVSFASYMDETAARADLILPDHTPLESWGDHVPEVGVRGLMQPTINPLFDTKAVGDVMLSLAARLGGEVGQRLSWPDFQAFLLDSWRAVHREHAAQQGFEEFWRESLARGGVWRQVGTQVATLNAAVAGVDFSVPSLAGDAATQFNLLPYASPTLYDGRGANRPWLQELPDPVTKAVWNSWVEMHPDTAAQLGVETGDMVTVRSPQGSLEAPAYVYRGIKPDTVAIPIGQGHTHYGRYARGRGVSPLALLPAAADGASGSLAWWSTRVSVAAAGRRGRLVVVQGSDEDHGREIAEVIGLAAAREAEAHAEAEIEGSPDALVEAALDADPKSPYRWGMAIDLSSCIGCSACVTACYAENNVPVVGEDACAQGREMAWLRIDRYYEHVLTEEDHGTGHAQAGAHDGAESDHVVHLPMLCQHCGNAPCEPVCPVYATYHNAEGLNVQVYNRCVGTRYCSNNCPYKVRRFEWFDYDFPFPLNLQLNPDVTVREKGIMEKCTFCVQRIASARNDANAENRDVADGEVVPACAQTCPTDAIVFGNLRDPDSRVSKLARSGRAYHVLDELNTRPAITYLKDVSRSTEEG